MPDISMEIKKSDVDNLLKKLDPQQRDGTIRQSLYQSGIFLSGWIKNKRLSGPRPQFLGVVTGRLRSSITATPTQKSGNTYFCRIGTNVIYGRRHEYGDEVLGITHKKGIGIPARPFMRPAVEDRANRQAVLTDLKRNVDKVLEA